MPKIIQNVILKEAASVTSHSMLSFFCHLM